ncbi:hypothetical protein ACFE04_001806 [Oxalis oulophora]
MRKALRKKLIMMKRDRMIYLTSPRAMFQKSCLLIIFRIVITNRRLFLSTECMKIFAIILSRSLWTLFTLSVGSSIGRFGRAHVANVDFEQDVDEMDYSSLDSPIERILTTLIFSLIDALRPWGVMLPSKKRSLPYVLAIFLISSSRTAKGVGSMPIVVEIISDEELVEEGRPLNGDGDGDKDPGETNLRTESSAYVRDYDRTNLGLNCLNFGWAQKNLGPESSSWDGGTM